MTMLVSPLALGAVVVMAVLLAIAIQRWRRTRIMLQAILEHSPVGIVIKDLEGRYLVADRQVQLTLGKPLDEIVGKFDRQLFPPETAKRFRDADLTVLRTRKPLITEERSAVENDGRIYLVSKFPLAGPKGRLFAICAIWQDITARKRAEFALERTAREMREAQRVAHLGSWTWDADTDTARWSDEMYRIFGRDPGTQAVTLFSEEGNLFSRPSLAALREAVSRLLSEGVPYELDLEFVQPDGTTGWVAVRGEPTRDASGRITGTSGTAQDITELKELQRLREEWTSIVAHDLRQPIGVISAAASALPSLHTGPMSNDERLFTERISSAANGLARMVNDLLDMSLIEAHRMKMEKKWVDPRSCVHDTVDRLAGIVGRERVKITEEPGVRPVYMDQMRIGQVLGNLISNAAKYGHKDTDISVHIAPREDDVEIAVSNRGPGIPPEELPRVFGRFMRSRQARGPGLGIGLYIAKELIEAHGGRIWVESTPHETTTFHVRLPSQAAASEAA